MRRLVEVEKTIGVPVSWTGPDAETGYIRFSVPLEVEGVTEAGLTLNGGAYLNYPDRHVTFELAIATARGRVRLVRVDWRSLKGGHSNSPRCPGEWSGRRVPESHLHCFDLNWVEAEQRMRRGKLPYAKPLDSEPQSFEELKDSVGIQFRIKNIAVVPRPEWVYSLFGGE
jgi:hypothetical protein